MTTGASQVPQRVTPWTIFATSGNNASGECLDLKRIK